MKYFLLSLSFMFFCSCIDRNQTKETTEETTAPATAADQMRAIAKTTLEEIKLAEKTAGSLRMGFAEKNALNPVHDYSTKIKTISGKENLLNSNVNEADQAYRVVRKAVYEFELAQSPEEAKQAEDRANTAKNQLLEIKARTDKILAEIRSLVK